MFKTLYIALSVSITDIKKEKRIKKKGKAPLKEGQGTEMTFLYNVNGYDIYEYSKKTCLDYGHAYPCYAAFTEDADRTPDYEECSMESIEALVEWCEKN